MLQEAWNEILQRYLSLEVFSIWHTRNAEQRREYVVQRLIKDWFPWFYWFFLIYSFLGLVSAYCICLSMYQCTPISAAAPAHAVPARPADQEPSIDHVACSCLSRHTRLGHSQNAHLRQLFHAPLLVPALSWPSTGGCSLSLSLSLSLYSTYNTRPHSFLLSFFMQNKPKCMRPWISISSLVLTLDFGLWTLEIMFGYDQFNWQCLISFALPFICQILLGNIGKLLEDPNHKLFDK